GQARYNLPYRCNSCKPESTHSLIKIPSKGIQINYTNRYTDFNINVLNIDRVSRLRVIFHQRCAMLRCCGCVWLLPMIFIGTHSLALVENGFN
ncbi:hypothetical protein SFRURICE_013516, partial [Spodoptera frugiperda]